MNTGVILARNHIGPFGVWWADGILAVLAVALAIYLALRAWGWPPSDWR